MASDLNNLNDVAVKASNITVSYRVYTERPTSLKESVMKFLKTGKSKYYHTFNALSDINFEVKKGEVFGIMGSNGAGKSTLLSVLSGVLPPTSGKLETFGSVDSLIQLGAGFDPELNAVENIYLYGSLRKKTRKQIAARIESIIDFAELHDFAYTPIKYYSSGMYARLGFAAAIDSNPDILIVDEVLAVGDERFRAKCDKVFENFRDQGKTIILVSHSLSMIQELCHRACLLSKGKILFLGDPAEAVKVYLDDNYQTALS